MAEPARLERRKRGDEPSERVSGDEGGVGECVGAVSYTHLDVYKRQVNFRVYLKHL